MGILSFGQGYMFACVLLWALLASMPSQCAAATPKTFKCGRGISPMSAVQCWNRAPNAKGPITDFAGGDSEYTVNKWLWSATGDYPDISPDCPLPETDNYDPNDGDLYTFKGGFTSRPSAIDIKKFSYPEGSTLPLTHHYDLPWLRKTVQDVDPRNAPGVKVELFGFVDYYGNIALCTARVSGPGAALWECAC